MKTALVSILGLIAVGAILKGEEIVTEAQVAINTATGSKWKTPLSGMKYEEDFRMASQYYGLPDGLLSRMAYQESRYNPKAVNSKSGAMGILQFMPDFRDGKGGFGIPAFDPFDPKMSISMAGKLMAEYFRRFGTWDKALAAYNWGYGNVTRKGLGAMPLETRNYVAEIGKDTGLIA